MGTRLGRTACSGRPERRRCGSGSCGRRPVRLPQRPGIPSSRTTRRARRVSAPARSRCPGSVGAGCCSTRRRRRSGKQWIDTGNIHERRDLQGRADGGTALSRASRPDGHHGAAHRGTNSSSRVIRCSKASRAGDDGIPPRWPSGRETALPCSWRPAPAASRAGCPT